MLLAFRASILVLKVLPERIGVIGPVLAQPAVATMTDITATRRAAVIKQAVPAVCVVRAGWALPVAARVLQMQLQAALRLETATAAIAVPGRCELKQRCWRKNLRGDALADFRAVCV